MTPEPQVGFDLGSPGGDYSVLSVGVTPEEYAALKRASVPPGDPEGFRIQQDIETRFLAEAKRLDPNVRVHFFIHKP